jgi:hypothetical protein
MPDFTGEETAADIARLLIANFSKSPISTELEAAFEITYQGDIPLLRFQAQVKNNLGEFVCQYRLDKMLLTVYPECEGIYDQAGAYGLFGDKADPQSRKKTVNHLAYYAMNLMLSRLLIHQLAMFEENFEDTMFFTSGTLLTAIANAYEIPGGEQASRIAKDGIRTMLDERLETSTKKKRELLVKLLNSLPSIQIPTGVGRPLGSTKPAEKKAEFEKQIEETIRQLHADNGEMPTKTAVAKTIGIGGLSVRGNDSSLQAFNNRLKRLNVDYKAIVERMKLNK